MEYLVLLPVIWLIVLLLTKEGGSKKTGSVSKHEDTEGKPFRHLVPPFYGRYVVIKAVQKSDFDYVIQVKSVKTGEVKTVHGIDIEDVSVRAWTLCEEWDKY